MFEAVARQGGMVGFNVHLDFFHQAMALEKAIHGAHVIVILVFGGFARFGLDQDGALEADLVFVLHHQVQEAAQLVHLLPHPGVEQCFIPLASAPQHIVFATQFQCRVHRLLDLQGGQGKDFRIGVGSSTRHESTVAEQVGSTPQQLDTRILLFAGQHVDHLMQVVHAIARGRTFGGDIPVMEAVIRCTELAEKFERRVCLQAGRCHGVGGGNGLLPRALKCAVVTKRIEPVPAETVPITRCKTQLLLHGFSQNKLVFIIPFK